MNQPRIMWVDLTVSVRQAEIPKQFLTVFELVTPHAGSSLESEIERLDPELLLFDFDYPERAGLKLMESTKRLFPKIPIVMMTVQHSESLAVWAFRARIWDYLVKPLSLPELDRCITALGKLFDSQNAIGRERVMHAQPSPVPHESRVRSSGTSAADLMPALSYIENHFREKVMSGKVARLCKMDTFQFSRAFASTFGLTFKEYLLRIRIREACRLLEKPDINIGEVAHLSGFNDPSYFSRMFKRYTGVAPSAFAASPEHRNVLGKENLSLIML